jgi:hypothetical protein
MNNYQTPKAFSDLFYDFTGYSHANYPKNQRAIAKDLSDTLAKGQDTDDDNGPLVVADSKGIYVYDSTSPHKLITSGDYRAAPNSGFYEVTSLSHVGPAIAYLGVLQKYGNEQWREHIAPMKEHLQLIRDINRMGESEHWLHQLNCPAWQGREDSIKKLVDYACGLAGNYLKRVEREPEAFCTEHILEHFLEVETNDFPIPYNTVMIATFSLAGLKSAYDIYSALSKVEINWQSAKILLRNLAGTNYSAGLTATSNWLFPLIKSIAGESLDEGRMFIVPYAPCFDNLGEKTMSDEQFNALASGVWGAIYSRPVVMNEAFANVPDITIPKRIAIEGDYDFSKASDIHHFVRRLKFSTGNIKEMLSNTVGFWLAGEAENKDWQVERMAIPGLTDGLPEGFSDYPQNLPDFND